MIKKLYHPIIDEETGLIIKQAGRKASMSQTGEVGILSHQQSFTNYADLVDEKSSQGYISSHFPQNFQTNLMKKPRKDVKPVRPLLDIRNSRLDEIDKG